MRTSGARMFAGLVVSGAVCLAVAVHAAEYNFYEQSGKKGCESIITERGQDACARVQRAKDDACRAPTECDLDKQERTIEKYKEAKERLARGDINDSDKARLEETIRDLKRDLDARKDGAERSIPVAERCVEAREEVQEWFMDEAIPLTERTRDEALRLRRDLLDKLEEAKKKQSDAKTKRDANPDDSSARSDYERATQEMRDAERALEEFNKKYGQDIERHASRLIDHYKDENRSHEEPIKQAKSRVEKCEALTRLSY